MVWLMMCVIILQQCVIRVGVHLARDLVKIGLAKPLDDVKKPETPAG